FEVTLGCFKRQISHIQLLFHRISPLICKDLVERARTGEFLSACNLNLSLTKSSPLYITFGSGIYEIVHPQWLSNRGLRALLRWKVLPFCLQPFLPSSSPPCFAPSVLFNVAGCF